MPNNETGWEYDTKNKTWRSPSARGPLLITNDLLDTGAVRTGNLSSTIYGSPARSLTRQSTSDGTATTLARSDHGHPREGFDLLPAVATAGTTTSATLVDAPGPLDFSIHKKYTDTYICALLNGTSFQTVAAGLQTFALQEGGVDYIIARLFFNTLGQHQAWGGAIAWFGTTAGTVSLRLRWRVTAGTGNFDVNDNFSLMFFEVPA